MQEATQKSIGFPILLVISGCILGAFIFVLSFGLFMPLSAAVVGLSLVLSGTWTLLNRSSRTSRVVASILISAPVLLIVSLIFRSQALHG